MISKFFALKKKKTGTNTEFKKVTKYEINIQVSRVFFMITPPKLNRENVFQQNCKNICSIKLNRNTI